MQTAYMGQGVVSSAASPFDPRTASIMWGRRLGDRAPREGVFRCGADTHPGWSVIWTSWRNAAPEVLGLLD